MKRRLAALVLFASSTPLAAQWIGVPTPGVPRAADGTADLSAPAPKSPDGHADLSGLWRLRGITGDLFDQSKVQDWARELSEEREQFFFGDDPGKQCLPRGPGFLAVGDQLRRIVQGTDVIAVLHEDFTHRQIFVDGRALEPNPNPNWMGYSVGRWEGDVLVVESNGFNDKTWLHGNGLSHTENLRVTERYRRLDFGHMQVEVTYEDPGTFDAPLHAKYAMEIAADDALLEVVCAEASEGRSHWVGATTDAEASDVEVSPDILAKYVGTYRGLWGTTQTTVEVTLEDGALLLGRNIGRNNAAEKSRMVAQSETAFASSNGLGYIFSSEGDGMATEVDEVHVSGAWTFSRVE